MRVSRFSRWFLIVGLIFPLAELTGAELVLTPASAARLALEQNRELQAARLLVAEAEARTQQAGRLPNPELNTEFAGGRDFNGRIEIGLTQRFPLTARLRLARTLSAFDVEMARLETAARENRLAVEVQAAAVELIALRESLGLLERQQALASDLTQSLEAQAREGMGSSLDVGQSRLAAYELETQVAALRIEEAQAAARLATLLGVSAETILSFPPALDFPSEPPAARATGDRPELRLAELAVEAGDAGIALARTAKWEDIGVGVFVEGERTRDSLGTQEREGLFGVRVDVPLPLWQKGDAQVSEKRVSRDRFARQLEAFKLAVRNETFVAFQVMTARHAAAQSITTGVIPSARAQLVDTEAAFARGEIDSQPVFRSRAQVLAFERAALDSRKTFELARIQWLAATGHLLSSP